MISDNEIAEKVNKKRERNCGGAATLDGGKTTVIKFVDHTCGARKSAPDLDHLKKVVAVRKTALVSFGCKTVSGLY